MAERMAAKQTAEIHWQTLRRVALLVPTWVSWQTMTRRSLSEDLIFTQTYVDAGSAGGEGVDEQGSRAGT